MKRIAPDEYFNNGLAELARFGKHIVLKNNMSSNQHKQLTAYLKSKYFEEIQKVNEKISAIKEKILRCDPIRLLSFSSDMGLLTFVNLFSESQGPFQDIPIARATEHIQSVLVSAPCNPLEYPDDDPIPLFHEILKDIEDLHTLIQNFYIFWGAKLEDLVPGIEDDILKSIVEAQMMHLVRGNRYQVFEIGYYKKLLKEHDDIFKDVFGIGTEDIINGISRLQYSVTQGKADALNQFQNIFEEFQNYGVEYQDTFFAEHKQEGEDFYNKFFGTQLRDVAKVTQWPENFIKELSWKLNDNTNSFNDSPFAGWPIIDLPVFKRPFIRINNISYCFDYYSFIDNFYRVIQKTITRLRPHYRWSDNQQVASEKMVENIFQSLLPHCLTYRSNYYPINNSMKQAAENDLIVLYDDVLIIVEVKAGSFVYTPPILDFDAHIKSYKSLIEKADWQCQRTKDYLTGKSQPLLYNENHKVKAVIDMDKISSIFMMSVTIDNINAFAAKAEKLRFMQLKSNAISIAVDDLMVYREYFNSPLMFLHFLQQRSLATQESKLALNDELDHLGMYIKHNCYCFQTDIIPTGSVGNFIGYREDLDNYFCKLYHPQLSPKKPLPNIPDLFLRIIHYLEVESIEGRSSIANYFLNFSTDAKNDFCNQVDYVLNRQKEIKREIPIHAAGVGENSLRYTCFVDQQGVIESSDSQKREYTLACLSWNNDPDRYLIDLSFDSVGNFIKVELKRFTLQDIKPEKSDQIYQLGKEVAERRMFQYHQTHKGKIGRNQLCPCGSGKKYKKCCGR